MLYSVYIFPLGICVDASMCIEHYGGKWQVKTVSSKGTDAAVAYVTGGRALEACATCVWSVLDGNTKVDQSSVKIVTGPDAEREVSGCCMHPQQRTNQSPPLPPLPCDALCFCAGH